MIRKLLLLLVLAIVAPAPAQVDDSRMLLATLTLRPETRERDIHILRAIIQHARRAGITAVLCKVPSMHEAPHAVDYGLVRGLQGICQRDGIDFVWGRDLWYKWLPRDGSTPTGDIDHLTSSVYYAQAIANITAEAAAIGADGTHMDCEPYAEARIKELYKGKDLSLSLLRAAQYAVWQAASLGQLDYIYPAESGAPRMQWLWPPLGRYQMSEATYRWKEPPRRLPKAPPGFEPWVLGDPKRIYGIWCSHDPTQYDVKPLTPEKADEIAATKSRVWFYISGGKRDGPDLEYGPTLQRLGHLWQARQRDGS